MYNLIKKWEGCSLKAYKCPANIWTIGWGSTRLLNGDPPQKTQRITQKEADELLALHVEKICIPAIKTLPTYDQLTTNQIEALASFVYNVGAKAFKYSTLYKIISQNPNDPQITPQFMQWVKANSITVKGLVTRRKEEALLYFTK